MVDEFSEYILLCNLFLDTYINMMFNRFKTSYNITGLCSIIISKYIL